MVNGDEMLMRENAGDRLVLLMDSYRRVTGQALAADTGELWNAPYAVLAHDTKAPPEFFYANARTLALFKRTAAAMIGLPSYHSAEPDAREERDRMLAQLEAKDVVTGYSGIRVAADGTRFRIVDAMIWNLRDADGKLHGQAARIDHVEMGA